jgi:hypothetical protein
MLFVDEVFSRSLGQILATDYCPYFKHSELCDISCHDFATAMDTVPK